MATAVASLWNLWNRQVEPTGDGREPSGQRQALVPGVHQRAQRKQAAARIAGDDQPGRISSPAVHQPPVRRQAVVVRRGKGVLGASR